MVDMNVEGCNPVDLEVHDLEVTRDGESMDDMEGDTVLLVCCDCGLAHATAFIRNKVTGEMFVVFARDNRSTAQFRRYEHGELIQGKSKKWKMMRKD